nr:DUF4465 domain-containing protein [uncultured Carboxylicivirga sp.]
MRVYLAVTFFAFSLIIASCLNDDKVIPEPTIYLDMDEEGIDVDIDSTYTIEPKIIYDISSSYAWQLNGENISTGKDFLFKGFDYGTYDFTFIVSTPSGSDSMNIPVHAIDFCTFEENELLEDSGFYYYSTEGYISFKHIRFSNNYNGNNIDWSGFAVSNKTDKTSTKLSNQFSVYNTSGAESSENFGVFKQSDEIVHKITFSDGQAHSLKSMEVNNTTLAYSTMIGGFEKKDTIDYYLLTINGYDDSNTIISSVDFYLADYQYPRSTERYIVTTWKPVDLTPLGDVYSISFQLTSSMDTSSDYTMPKYFCFDNLKIKN